MLRALILLSLLPQPALADSVVAVRTLPARTVITAEDITLVAAQIPGAMEDLTGAVGKETLRAIYAGRPVRKDDLSAPALVDRNKRVVLIYRSHGLTIRAEGRALARGGAGEVIPVMNIASRTTVQGAIAPDGTIIVGDME